MTTKPESAHQALVDQIEKRLQRRSYPRLQMMIIVSLTGATGLLASAMLLRLGMTEMGVRYPLSVLIAYGAFLALLWLWIRNIAAEYSNLLPAQLAAEEAAQAQGTQDQPPINLAEPVGALGAVQGLSAQEADAREQPFAKVTRFFHTASATPSADHDGTERGPSKETQASKALLVPLLVGALFLGLALSSLYVVATAPALLAELVVDSTLSYSLYTRLVRTQEPNWLRAAVTRTIWPLVITTLFVSIVGWTLSDIAPGAHTLGEAWGVHT